MFFKWFVICVNSEGRFEIVGGGSLYVLNLTEEDAGTFSCLADNRNDSIEAQVELTIQGTIPCLLPQLVSFYSSHARMHARTHTNEQWDV